MPLDPVGEKTIGVTAFKTRCLALIDDVARGKIGRIILMKHNRPIAMIAPIEHAPVELWGAMRGSVRIATDTDLTRPTGTVWEAET